jgi:subtilisin family serine protease
VVSRFAALPTCAVIVAVLLVPWASASAQDTSRIRIVVGFKPDVTSAQRAEIVARDGGSLVRDIGPLAASEATVPAESRDAILARLRAEPAIAFAELDRPIGLDHPRIGAPLRLAHAAVAPNDEGFDLQYALRDSDDHDVDATNAWDRRTQCATVAVLDTGIKTDHKDLRDNIWVNEHEISGNGLDDDHNGYVDDYKGADLIDARGSGVDKNGHGTHVAGIVAARGNNDRGVSGLCWKARLMAVRILDADGHGYQSTAAEGIVYAVDQGVRVINASYGSPAPSEIEREAIRYAGAHGAVIVAAAGNEHLNADKHPFYPAAYPDANVISVAASDQRDRLASFSNYGETSVDLAAPGSNIASTWDDGDYRGASGTSMASPLVSAAAAMLRKAGVHSPERIRELLLKYADDKSKLKGKVASSGRLNINRALAAA